MSFFTRLKIWLANFMRGRYGADQLGQALCYGSMAMLILGLLPYLGLATLLAYVMIIWAIARMLSRNSARRGAENMWYLTHVRPLFTHVKQAFIRLKNARKYRYFKCPNCASRLKLPRGVGNVKVTCGKCGHQFEQKA